MGAHARKHSFLSRRKVWNLCGSVVLISALLVDRPAFGACDQVGDLNTDLELSGKVIVATPTCYFARDLTFKGDLELTANGQATSFEAARNLRAEAGSKILSLRYDALDYASTFPPQKLADKPVAGPPYDPGPRTAGNSNGRGRDGPTFGKNVHYIGLPGQRGLDAPPITLKGAAQADGELLIIAHGGNGQRGGDGGAGWSGGSGEQGRQGQSQTFCVAGGSSGGNGGRGLQGDTGGAGGDGGNGGNLSVFFTGASKTLRIKYDIRGGLGGAAGKPGDGGKGGLQGCGGRANGRCFQSEAIRKQGELGTSGTAGRFGIYGEKGIAGGVNFSGDFVTEDIGSEDPCGSPPSLDQATKESTDKTMYFTFWVLAGKDLIGNSSRFVSTKDGKYALVVQYSAKGILSFLDPARIAGFVRNPPPMPSSVPPNCSGVACCLGSVWAGCLSHVLWHLSDNIDGQVRYQDRLKWRDKLDELLSIEAAKSAFFLAPGTTEGNVLEGDVTYAELNFFGTTLYIRLEEDLFTRIVLTLSRLHTDIRVALDARTPIDPSHNPSPPVPARSFFTGLYCSFGQANRVAGSASWTYYPKDGVANALRNVQYLPVVSNKAGVELQSPTPTRQFAVLPIGNARSETIFDPVVPVAAADADFWPERPGFKQGGFCQFYSSSTLWRDSPLNCSLGVQHLRDAMVKNWQNLDVPSLIAVLHFMAYLQTLFASEQIDLSRPGGGPELALHCFSDP